MNPSDAIRTHYALVQAAWLRYWELRRGMPHSAILATWGRLSFHQRAAEIVADFNCSHRRPPTVEELLYQISARRPHDEDSL